MRFVDVINKKRYNEELTDQEIQFFVDGVRNFAPDMPYVRHSDTPLQK